MLDSDVSVMVYNALILLLGDGAYCITLIKEEHDMEKYQAISDAYMRVGEIAKIVGVSVRTLQYYDKEGLLSPSAESAGGFRLYSSKDIMKLMQILLLKGLGFSLAEIKSKLAGLNTTEDVVKMLDEQMEHTLIKVEEMHRSIEAMKALKEEISAMKEVNFKKYFAILFNVKAENIAYKTIKYFDDEALDEIAAMVDRETAAEIIEISSNAHREVYKLYEDGVSPESSEAQEIAKTFWDGLMSITSGDMQLISRISEIAKKCLTKDAGENSKYKVASKFLEQALNVYIQMLSKEGEI